MTAILHDFFSENLDTVYFFYGLVFFLMGFAILIQNKSFSNMKLARSLKYLAVFAILHGVSEWAVIFINLYRYSVSSDILILFRVFENTITAASFMFLFIFGAKLVRGNFSKSGSLLSKTPILLFVVWLIVFLGTMIGYLGELSDHKLINGFDTLGRYFLAFPGALLTGYGFLCQSKEFKKLGVSKITNNLLYVALAFFIYAFLAGLVVRESYFIPSIWLNKSSFFETIGFPVQVLRAITGAFISICMIKALDIFNIEYRKKLEEAEMKHAILLERDRIGKDLHDGVIQSIYAVGLNLENSIAFLQKDANVAEKMIRENMRQLDVTIKDIRNYILNLSPGKYNSENYLLCLSNLVKQVKAHSLIDCEFKAHEEINTFLDDNQKVQIYHIMQEALNNIIKHSKATNVIISLERYNDEIIMKIKDNGQGFNVKEVLKDAGIKSNHYGINNMIRRAEDIEGYINFNSNLGKGTEISLRIKGRY